MSGRFVGAGSWLATLIPIGLAVTANGQSQKKPDSWFLSATSPASAITASTSHASLVSRFGKENVVDVRVELGEGESEPGTVLFPYDPVKKVEVLWKDAGRSAPKSVYLTGEKSDWHTLFRISLGTDLLRLERLNRKPFTLAGFGFDYGGTVTSWRDGFLAQHFDHPRVIVRLSPQIPEQMSLREYRSVLGDHDFSSGHPAMQKLNPTVYQIIFQFP